MLTLASSCYRVVPEEEPDTAGFVNPGPPALFSAADSLMLCGRADEALEELCRILESSPDRRDEGLFRILGLYHSRGLESEGAAFLDSLEGEWGTSLAGWRTSLLDLGGDREGAASIAADPYLDAYLSGYETVPALLEPPSSPPELLCRLLVAPAGTLTDDQMKACADVACLFPDAADRLVEEMRKRLSIPAEVWARNIGILRRAGRAEQADLLEISRMGATGRLDEQIAGSLLVSTAGPAGEAALLLVSRGAQGWRRSWEVADALALASHTSTLSVLVDESVDPVFTAGARMALLRARSEPSDLLELCDDIPPSSPDSLLARAALFRARALRDLDRDSEAWSAYLEFAESWPSHPAAHESAFLAGRYHDGEQQWDMAARAFEAAIEAQGPGKYDESCYWRGGFAHLAGGDPEGARVLWIEGCDLFPAGFWRDEMLYWTARTLPSGSAEQSSLLEQVSAGHPWEYYGMLAADRMGGSPAWTPPFPSMNPPGEAVELAAAGYGTLAANVLRFSALPDSASRIAALSMLGEHKEAIELCGALDSRMRYSGGGVVPESIAVFQFPTPYADLVSDLTAGLSLQPALIHAIMREESSFDHEACSSVGAKGLIQLMPGTAYDVARWYALPFLEGDQLFDPENSIRYGSLYINRQWNAYSGALPLVLAAYNAGPGNASRWRDSLSFSASDPEWFIERITFRETREYVKRVTRSSWVYGRLSI